MMSRAQEHYCVGFDGFPVPHRLPLLQFDLLDLYPDEDLCVA